MCVPLFKRIFLLLTLDKKNDFSFTSAFVLKYFYAYDFLSVGQKIGTMELIINPVYKDMKRL